MSAVGKVYDLGLLMSRLNRLYFDGKLQLKIRWSRRSAGKAKRGVLLGSFSPKKNEITISNRLDNIHVPLFFVEHVVFHEILHSVFPREPHRMHSEKFKKFEKLHPDYEAARQWEKSSLHILFSKPQQKLPGLEKPRTALKRLATLALVFFLTLSYLKASEPAQPPPSAACTSFIAALDLKQSWDELAYLVKILSLIRHRSMTRTEMDLQTGLEAASIEKLLSRLIRHGLLQERDSVLSGNPDVLDQAATILSHVENLLANPGAENELAKHMLRILKLMQGSTETSFSSSSLQQDLGCSVDLVTQALSLAARLQIIEHAHGFHQETGPFKISEKFRQIVDLLLESFSQPS